MSKCHKCGEPNSYYRLKERRGFGCTKCGEQYFPCVNTIFEKSKLDLKCWFDTVDLLINGDCSGHEISRITGVCVAIALKIKKKIIDSGLFNIPDRSKKSKCKRCKVEKEKTEKNFRIRKGKEVTMYMRGICKDCEEKDNHIYRLNIADSVRESLKITAKKWRLSNREALNEYQKTKRNKPHFKEKRRAYIKKNKEKIHKQEKVTKRRYAEKHRDQITDQYCITRLIQKSDLSKADVQSRPDLIAFYRAKLLLEREIRKLTPIKQSI